MAKKTKYKNVPVSPENKRELEEIRHELEGFLKERLSFDSTIGHIIKVYKDTMKLGRVEKTKQKKIDSKLSLENIIVGDIIPDLHNKNIEITDDLIEQMKIYEQDSGKSAIWHNKITGSFLFYKLTKENPQEKNKSKKL